MDAERAGPPGKASHGWRKERPMDGGVHYLHAVLAVAPEWAIAASAVSESTDRCPYAMDRHFENPARAMGRGCSACAFFRCSCRSRALRSAASSATRFWESVSHMTGIVIMSTAGYPAPAHTNATIDVALPTRPISGEIVSSHSGATHPSDLQICCAAFISGAPPHILLALEND